jgi:hypothetical protein
MDITIEDIGSLKLGFLVSIDNSNYFILYFCDRDFSLKRLLLSS